MPSTIVIVLMICSCFSHAIAIAKGKFLKNLSLTNRKAMNGSSCDEEHLPVIDPSINNEDIEEHIEELVKEVDAVIS